MAKYVYAIGEKTGSHEYGMWAGPNPDLNSIMEEYDPEGKDSIILRFIKDTSNGEPIYEAHEFDHEELGFGWHWVACQRKG